MYKKKLIPNGNEYIAQIFDEKELIETKTLPSEWHAYHWAIQRIAQMKELDTAIFGRGAPCRMPSGTCSKKAGAQSPCQFNQR